jgi:hypothetical protein
MAAGHIPFKDIFPHLISILSWCRFNMMIIKCWSRNKRWTYYENQSCDAWYRIIRIIMVFLRQFVCQMVLASMHWNIVHHSDLDRIRKNYGAVGLLDQLRAYLLMLLSLLVGEIWQFKLIWVDWKLLA